jgi:CBS domain-containing protein
MGTIMVKGDCKDMSTEFIRGASFTKYGTTLYVGLGVPIPILNEEIAKKVSIKDEEIYTDIIDYGVPRRDRPKLGRINYKELKSGKITIKDKKVKVSSLSSLKKARLISETLKKWIDTKIFYLSSPSQTLPTDSVCRPMKQSREVFFVVNIVHKAVVCKENEEIQAVAQNIVKHSINHIVIVNNQGKLKGIVTSWDITKTVAEEKNKLKDIFVHKVITTTMNEPLETASRKMTQNKISALPVINQDKKVIGIVTSEDIAKLIGGKSKW